MLALPPGISRYPDILAYTASVCMERPSLSPTDHRPQHRSDCLAECLQWWLVSVSQGGRIRLRYCWKNSGSRYEASSFDPPQIRLRMNQQPRNAPLQALFSLDLAESPDDTDFNIESTWDNGTCGDRPKFIPPNLPGFILPEEAALWPISDIRRPPRSHAVVAHDAQSWNKRRYEPNEATAPSLLPVRWNRSHSYP